MNAPASPPWLRLLSIVAALSALPTFAQDSSPARIGRLAEIEGSAGYAPAGETEWSDAAAGARVAQGDRLWTDQASRAVLRVGAAVFFMDSQTFLDVATLDDRALQVALNKGTVAARVRRIGRGENFEIDTPQLALRATRAGDFRLDVDAGLGVTQVAVRRGAGVVYGAGGESLEVAAGDVLAFRGQHLQEAAPRVADGDAFDRWAAQKARPAQPGSGEREPLGED